MRTQEEWESYAAHACGKSLNFDGATFDPKQDAERLGRQLDHVRELMSDGAWRSLSAIAEATGHPETSISSRLRDLRKTKFGGHKVERRFVRAGLFEYRLILNPNPQPK